MFSVQLFLVLIKKDIYYQNFHEKRMIIVQKRMSQNLVLIKLT